MTNKIKLFAAMMVAGATVTAYAAAPVNTNTFTNVIQSVSINLVLNSNAPYKSATLQAGGKPVTVNTKTIIAALSNASSTIPALVGFDWGKTPQLVLRTIFAATETISNSVTTVTNPPVILGASNASVITFGTNQVTVSVPGSMTITNTKSGTNLTSTVTATTGSFAVGSTNLTTTSFTYTGTNGAATNAALSTNGNTWIVITATTDTNANTNLTAVLYTNVPHITGTNFTTNYQGIVIQGGTAKAPTFAPVEDFVYAGSFGPGVTLMATGTGFGTTNGMTNSSTTEGSIGLELGVFNTNASTAAGNNLSLEMSGVAKLISKYDVLSAVKKAGTNEVRTYTTAGAISGSGYIGGSFLATNSLGAGTNGVPTYYYQSSEYYDTNSATNVTGFLVNPISVVGQGTLSVGAPHASAQ